tara:strand:- start:215 stop:445 length:231 start_codon:yes stop_codon:yes gene_type:complete
VPTRDPIQWKLEGSHDGYNWTLVDEHHLAEPFAERLATKHFSIEKSQRFKTYRFVFQPLDQSHFQIGEIQLNFTGK